MSINQGKMQVIQGNKKEKTPKWVHYSRAFIRFMNKYETATAENLAPDERKKYIFLGVNSLIHWETDKTVTKEVADSEFTLISSIMGAIGLITPAELMQIFPVEKTYDGEKIQSKDYFSTMEAIQKLDEMMPIGAHEDVISLLWDYDNMVIRLFMVRWMGAVSNLRRLEGYEDPFTEFMRDKNIPSYTLHKKEGYIQNNLTGEITKASKVKKRTPRYLKVSK